MTLSCHVASKHIQDFLGAFFKHKMRHVMVSKKNPAITVCHHSASLVMPNGDPRDRFFYPTLTLMIDPFNIGRIRVNALKIMVSDVM